MSTPAPYAGAVPPHDLEAELDILVECMTDPAKVAIVAGQITAEDFWSPDHGQIWRAIVAAQPLTTAPIPDDHLNIAKRVEERYHVNLYPIGPVADWLADNGGLANNKTPERIRLALWQLALDRPNNYPTLRHAIQRTRDKSRLRKCTDRLHRALAEAYRDNGPYDAQAYFERLALDITALRYDGAAVPFTTLAAGETTPGEDTEGADARPRIRSQIEALDDVIGGWRPGDTYAITAPEGGGKTALILEQCAQIAALEDEDGHRPFGVYLWSGEMPKARVHLRAACRLARVDLRKASTAPKELTVEERRALEAARETIRGLDNWLIDDRKDLGVEQIRGAIHQARRHFAIKRPAKALALVALDYYQLTGAAPELPRNATREERLNHNGIKLVHLSEELQVPILLAAQTNSDGTEFQYCRAMRKHVQNWIHVKLGKLVDPTDNAGPREVAFDIRKGRDTGTAKVSAYFHGPWQRFADEAYG